jgi:uncharacterized protein (TIGR03435 family)
MARPLPSLALLLSFALYGQALPPLFEVASVKLTPISQFEDASGITTRHGRLTAHNVTLKRCIMGAFSVGHNQVSGGPPWLDTDRFEIEAKAHQPIEDDAVFMTMLQSLLADRFRLAVHHESKTLQAYVLDVAKPGPKLEKTDNGLGNTNSSRGRLDAQGITMDRLADTLSRQMDLPVVNRTGLTGVFNLKLEWSRENPGAAGTPKGDPDRPSIFTAIQEQLGLRLHSQKTEIETIVIEHAERPDAN